MAWKYQNPFNSWKIHSNRFSTYIFVKCIKIDNFLICWRRTFRLIVFKCFFEHYSNKIITKKQQNKIEKMCSICVCWHVYSLVWFKMSNAGMVRFRWKCERALCLLPVEIFDISTDVSLTFRIVDTKEKTHCFNKTAFLFHWRLKFWKKIERKKYCVVNSLFKYKKLQLENSIMNKSDAETVETPKNTSMDFGELRNDTEFIAKSTNLENVSVFFLSVF